MPRRTQIRLLFLSVLLVSVSTLPIFLTGAAFFQIGPELGIGPLGLGGLTAAFFLTAAATSARLGRWVLRVGWSRAMRINIVASAVVTALIAPLARNVWALGLLLMAAAVMYGSANPAANQALAEHTSPARNATVFGIKHAGIPSSTLLAGLAVPAVVVRFGWRPAFLAAAVLAVAVWFLVPRSLSAPTAPSPVGRPRVALSRRDLHRLAIVAGLGAVGATALGTFLVSAAVDGGLSEVTAGWLQFAGSGASITARLVAGVVVDRRGGSLHGLVTLLAVGAVGFFLLAPATGALFAVLVLVAYATGWGWPGLMTATVVQADREVAASTSAITQAGVFVGAGGGPLLLGWVAEHWSYAPMWLVVAVCLLIGTLIASSVLSHRRSLAAI